MVNLNTEKKKLKGIIFKNDDIIGVVDNADSYLDLLCQIKEEGCDEYRMEVDVPLSNGDRRTYVYHFDKEGKMSPASYPNVRLWIDELNSKMLYLYNFTLNYNK